MLIKFYLIVGACVLLAFLISCAASRISDLFPASTAAPTATPAPTGGVSRASTPEPLLTDASISTPAPSLANVRPTPSGSSPASLPPWVSVSTLAPDYTPVPTNTPAPALDTAPAGASAPDPGPSLQYPGDISLDASEIEHWVVVFINEEREAIGVPPLAPNPAIADIARAHSENMHRLGKTSNQLEGKGSKDRARAAGYNYCTGFVGNVIKHPRIQRFAQSTSSVFGVTGRPTAYGADSKEVARDLVANWMGGPSRDNILKSKYQSTGVGAYIDVGENLGWAWETVYVTQNFSGCG